MSRGERGQGILLELQIFGTVMDFRVERGAGDRGVGELPVRFLSTSIEGGDQIERDPRKFLSIN